MKPELQTLAFSIYTICLSKNIDFSVAWVPREQNVEADLVSKVFDFDDWTVSNHIFSFFNTVWGPYTCDIFASCNNFKVNKFYSLFWTPGTSGVDAFAFDWSQDVNWIVPPISLIGRAVRHLLNCGAKGTLVVPKWKSAAFWPSLIDKNGKFLWFVKDSIEYKHPTIFFVPGSDKNSIFAAQKFNSNVIALNLDASFEVIIMLFIYMNS